MVVHQLTDEIVRERGVSAMAFHVELLSTLNLYRSCVCAQDVSHSGQRLINECCMMRSRI